MPSAIHQPRALLDWQARAVRAGEAHLFRISHDGQGNWRVSRPGSDQRLYFPADLDTRPDQDGPARVGEVPEPAQSARGLPIIPPTDGEKYAAEYRSSFPNLSA